VSYTKPPKTGWLAAAVQFRLPPKVNGTKES
jgi:hypothetical protein